MWKFIVKRVLLMIPIILGVTLVVFTIMYFTPGSPGELMAGTNPDPEVIEQINHDLGFDQPFHMIDYSAKPMLYGEKTLQESGRELYDLILRVANGEETKAEKLGDYSWTTPHGTSYNGDY